MASEASRRYARAVYELAVTKGAADKIYSELVAVVEVFKLSPESQSFIVSPVVEPQKKIIVLSATLEKLSEEVKNLILLLIEKKRINLFSDIVSAYRDISDASSGKTRGAVRSAAKLNDDEKKQIEIKIKKATGKEVILSYTEDKNLLGGLVAQVGGWTFNDSLESHLTRIGEDLHRRTN